MKTQPEIPVARYCNGVRMAKLPPMATKNTPPAVKGLRRVSLVLASMLVVALVAIVLLSAE